MDLPEVARLHDLLMMNRFRMRSGGFEPGADGLGLQAKGMFERDQGTAPTDEGDDHDDACLVGTAAMKDRAGAGAEGFVADMAVIALFLPTMDADVALPSLSSCGTGQVGAPYRLRIHGASCLVRHPGLSMDPSFC